VEKVDYKGKGVHVSMTKNFGRLFEKILHIMTALEIVLAYLYVLDLFKPSYTALFHGTIWSSVYSLGLSDHGLYGLIPLLAISLALALCAYEAGGFKAVKPFKLACYVLATLTFMNLPLLLYWMAYMWNPRLLLGYGFRLYATLSDIDASLFHIYAPLYPLLLLVTLYAWLLLPIRRVLKGCMSLKIRYNRILNTANDYQPLKGTFAKRLCLASALLLSIALPIIPYFPTINPEFKPVSVDILFYSRWLDNMLTVNDWNWSTIKYAFYGNRPLYLLLLYSLTKLGIPKKIILNFEALLISPLFVLTVYYAAKRLSGDDLYALLSSLAAVLGFNMTVGMMAGFFAAWTALIPFYICVALTPRLTDGSLKSLSIALVSSIGMLYIHPWTWSLLMAILTLHLASSTLQSLRKGNFKLDKHLLTVLIGNAIADIVKTITYPNYGGLASSTDVLGYSKAFGLEPLLDLPRNLQRLTVSYVDGLFFNPLHMALALIGVLSLSKKGDSLSRLFIIWLAVVSLIFPFSNVDLQSHLLFATPFPILIAEGLWALSRLLARFDGKLPRLLQAFFIVSSLTYAIRALCNLI
jgi:hypothetical protein